MAEDITRLLRSTEEARRHLGTYWRRQVERICPKLDDIPRLLHEKQEVVIKGLRWSERLRRFVANPDFLAAYAKHVLGKLQRADYSEKPIPERVALSIFTSVPALFACEAAWRKLLYNETVNNVFVLVGPGGYGKSTIAWFLAVGLGGVMVPPGQDPSDTVLWLRENDIWVPILVFDDVAAWLSKYWFLHKSKSEQVSELMRAVELVRDVAGVLLLTARSFSGVAKRLREIASYSGTMRLIVVRDRYVFMSIWWHEIVEGEYRSKPSFLDITWPKLRIPDEAYKRMMEIRKAVMQQAIRGYLEQGGAGRGRGKHAGR